LIPLDKIGHSEELTLAVPPSVSQSKAILGKISLSITTDGTSKILTIKDRVDELDEQQHGA